WAGSSIPGPPFSYWSIAARSVCVVETSEAASRPGSVGTGCSGCGATTVCVTGLPDGDGVGCVEETTAGEGCGSAFFAVSLGWHADAARHATVRATETDHRADGGANLMDSSFSPTGLGRCQHLAELGGAGYSPVVETW